MIDVSIQKYMPMVEVRNPLTTIETLIEQINVRMHLIRNVLVGNLYSGICATEIEEIEALVEMKRMLNTGYHRTLSVIEDPIHIPE